MHIVPNKSTSQLTQSTSHERVEVEPQDPGQQEEKDNGLESQIKA